MRKKFGILLQTLANDLELMCNLEPFSTSVSADEAYQMFQEEIESEEYVHDIMYIYTIINILKSYYDEQELQDLVPYGTDEFKYLLTVITDYTDHEQNYIKYDFPAYLNHHECKKKPVCTNYLFFLLHNWDQDIIYILKRTSDGAPQRLYLTPNEIEFILKDRVFCHNS